MSGGSAGDQQKKKPDEMGSKDEVDFIRRDPKELSNGTFQCPITNRKCISGPLYGDCEIKTNIKSSLSTLEKFSLFRSNSRKKLDKSGKSENSSPKEKPKFTKSASIARLLGNNYSMRKSESETAADSVNSGGSSSSTGCNSVNSKNDDNSSGNCTRANNRALHTFGPQERFQKCSKLEEIFSDFSEKDIQNVSEKDISAKALRTISRGLGKLWWKRTHSVNISAPDPEFKVSYLGNVLTGWAKGDGCVEKPLSSLWRNYTQNHKPDIIMRMRVCASGLKATTRQHGLTEYWAHRITHCCAPKNYPRLFCWVYRHEGRKMKHEMRCHAVLCAKESIAKAICNTLRENLDRALRDFKREKISKQNARLSLANAVYENPSLPRRKILLSVGGNNYRPPLERSKSAPKLMAIEEAIGEEGEEEETNEPEMPSCCVKDSLYPAMTLGRRRCRRGHSIRRTGKYPSKPQMPSFEAGIVETKETSPEEETTSPEFLESPQCCERRCEITDVEEEPSKTLSECYRAKSVSSLVSEEDEVDKLLSRNDYDTNSPLSNELLSYFDMKMRPRTASLTNLQDINIMFEPTPTPNDKARRRATLSLDNLDSYSDEENEDEYDDEDEESDDTYFRQTAILNLLHNESILKSGGMSAVGGNSVSGPLFDSDEGSISSGCETASTVTANVDDSSLRYIQSQDQEAQQQQPSRTQCLSEKGAELVFKEGDQNQEKLSIQSNVRQSTVAFKLPNSNAKHCNGRSHNRNQRSKDGEEVSDSEFSDESGYVEFQDNILLRHKSVAV